MTKFQRGSPEYWFVVQDDADLFWQAAFRLGLYRTLSPWWVRPFTSFVIGFLRARSVAMHRLVNAQPGYGRNRETPPTRPDRT